MINIDGLDVNGEILGSYWDKEAKYVKEKYKTIPFPFNKITVPALKTTFYWNLHQLWDYMETWSSVKRYCSENKLDPLELVKPEVKTLWGDELKKRSYLEHKHTCRDYKIIWKLFNSPLADSTHFLT